MVVTPTFVFDEATHTYRETDHGMILPSVTQVLKENNFINFDRVPPAVLERKRRLGSLVHKLTEIYDCGEDLSDYEIPAACEPYVEGWVNFRFDSGFQPVMTEHQRIGEIHGMRFGMKLDVIGKLNGELYIIEKKCGASESVVWGLQTGLYDLGLHNKATAKRAAVQLGPQFARNYKLFSYADPVDYQIGVGALALTIWKQNHGLFVPENIPERLELA